MLINLSNHPVEKWSEKQINEAKKNYGEIRDLPFPEINPDWDEETVENFSQMYFEEIQAIIESAHNQNNAVHVMGELTFTFNIVYKLLSQNIVCIASTSKRNVTEKGNKKITEFNFVRFREYKK